MEGWIKNLLFYGISERKPHNFLIPSDLHRLYCSCNVMLSAVRHGFNIITLNIWLQFPSQKLVRWKKNWYVIPISNFLIAFVECALPITPIYYYYYYYYYCVSYVHLLSIWSLILALPPPLLDCLHFETPCCLSGMTRHIIYFDINCCCCSCFSQGHHDPPPPIRPLPSYRQIDRCMHACMYVCLSVQRIPPYLVYFHLCISGQQTDRQMRMPQEFKLNCYPTAPQTPSPPPPFPPAITSNESNGSCFTV